MAYHVVAQLPDAQELKEEFPPDIPRVLADRDAIRAVLAGRDPRLMFIVGPCSAWPPDRVEEYSDRLVELQDRVREKLLLVLRCYIQKPRTVLGWTGIINQPNPLAPPDIAKGIRTSAKMMANVSQQLPVADEMLFTHNADYFGDYLSYAALGARSSEDPEHRYIASLFEPPMGVKHGTDGDLRKGVNSVQAVQAGHDLALGNKHIATSGNHYAHLILRGSEHGPNYHPAAVALAKKLLLEQGRRIRNPAIVIDASHDNSLNGDGKDPTIQKFVVKSVLQAMFDQRAEYSLVRGFMVESFLYGGNQKIRPGMGEDGLSITDPCLSWEETQKLLLETADALDQGNRLLERSEWSDA
jgi:3-deoxy-7-phosphoheptulonate synthase